MIATAPLAARTETTRLGLDFLLLGDLRQLLEETPGGMRDRWLLATLDLLLMSRPRLDAAPFRSAIVRENEPGSVSRLIAGNSVPFAKLQRLRDRIVHRAPYAELAQELRGDLRDCFETSSRS